MPVTLARFQGLGAINVHTDYEFSALDLHEMGNQCMVALFPPLPLEKYPVLQRKLVSFSNNLSSIVIAYIFRNRVILKELTITSSFFF